ncbi:hypothetical protein BD626DRAFT_602942 [Schizophyllum amplum]|uniref:Uncharacterized protein n=1 Tax=Schizophyllum amplum TaxID=97359 RepID=A0A550CV78_9AGAR|nr:hypothetical protein BD626DRAFT_602942 [Auriculariopsis ampla]
MPRKISESASLTKAPPPLRRSRRLQPRQQRQTTPLEPAHGVLPDVKTLQDTMSIARIAKKPLERKRKAEIFADNHNEAPPVKKPCSSRPASTHTSKNSADALVFKGSKPVVRFADSEPLEPVTILRESEALTRAKAVTPEFLRAQASTTNFTEGDIRTVACPPEANIQPTLCRDRKGRPFYHYPLRFALAYAIDPKDLAKHLKAKRRPYGDDEDMSIFYSAYRHLSDTCFSP